MKVIIPCCGKSSRFPNQPPKWMLPAHDGRPMICLATSGIQCPTSDFIVTILREHEEQFGVTAGLACAFGQHIRTCILERPTRSQSETVAETLRNVDLQEPFLVKDSDNTFVLNDVEQPSNYVCTDSLNNFESINPRNKSYLQVDHNGIITNIREKTVISDTFNVGGYYYTSPEQFLAYYDRLATNVAEWNREIYLSDVIGAMILDGIPFRARSITGYSDWGTVREWRRALLNRKSYFVLLDGFVFQRGSAHFAPRFDDVQPHVAAVEVLNKLAAMGHQMIYLSIRPPTLACLTESQIKAAGVPVGQIVYNCAIAQWTLVTAPHATLPFLTCDSLELQPDDVNLLETIRGDRFHEGL